MSTQIYQTWCAKWRSRSKLEGYVERPIWSGGALTTFTTKREAVAWIKENYGYIAERSNLRKEPHGWLMPVAVKARITVEIL